MSKAERYERSLARELSSLIPTLKDPRIPMIVTVEDVRLSADGRSGKVLVSTLDDADKDEMLAALNRASGYLQNEASEAVGLRFTPRLTFYLDALEMLT